jgi:hypothetical protein
MYLDDANLETAVLRQGDVLSNVQILGAINLNSILYLTNAQNKKTSWTIPNSPQFADVIVLSHSCEVSLENNIKVTSIILSPLRDVNTATAPEKIEELKRSNYIESGTEASYLKYFYLSPSAKLQYKNGVIADYSKCFSVRKNSYELLLRKKILQLTPEAREKMAIKLAIYFYRKA